MECGTAIGARGAGSRPATPAPEAPPEERRHATVLFADLSGYTAAAERMDPEAVKALVDRTLRRLGEEIERFGGTIDKFIGDNVMGVFGAPVAHEDDPERGGPRRARDAGGDGGDQPARSERARRRHLLAAGRDQLGRGDGRRRRRPLHGDGRRGQRRRAAPGRRAARHASRSASATYRASRDRISYERLEPLTLKGKEEPVPAWEATGDPRGPAARRPSQPDPADRPRARRPSCWPRSWSGSSARAARTWSPSSARPASASRGCCAS